jgi:hypothetical protein
MTQKSKKRFRVADELLISRNYADQINNNMASARKKAGERFLKMGIPLTKDEY